MHRPFWGGRCIRFSCCPPHPNVPNVWNVWNVLNGRNDSPPEPGKRSNRSHRSNRSKRSWQKKRSKRSYRSNRSCAAVCIRPAAVVQSSQKEAAAYDQTAYRARQDSGPGRAGPQPEKRERRYPPALHHRHRRGVGVGQVQPGAGGAVRRGVAAVSGRPVHLHPAADDPGRPGRRGRGALCPGGAGPAPAAGGGRDTLHLRHRHRAAQQPAADVLPAGQPPLPKRALSGPQHRGGGRAGAGLPGMRGAFLRPLGRGAGLQQPGGLPHLRRHRHGAHRRPGHPRPRPEPDHRPGRRRPLEQPDVVPDDRRLPRHGGAHRRALPGPESTTGRWSKSTSSTGPKTPTPSAPASWTSPTTAPSTPSSTPCARSRTKRG